MKEKNEQSVGECDDTLPNEIKLVNNVSRVQTYTVSIFNLTHDHYTFFTKPILK